MATTNSLRPIVDRKTWEFMTPSPATSAAGASFISANAEDPHSLQMFVGSTTAQYIYHPKEDAWQQIATVTLGGTTAFGSGAYTNPGPTGTATAGSATTMSTGLTIPGSLAGYKIRITAGTGRGQEPTILYNTTGANAVFTFTAALGTALDATSVYELRTGRFWVFNGGTMSATSFQYYDVATNTWTARSVTSAPASTTADIRLIATSSTAVFATGTATSATATTLVNSGKAWTTNQWTNQQVRITGGTGAGQVRVITSNTATALTVATWTVTPDATSTYTIEGDDYTLYLMGNAAVTLYKYSITNNTWSTLTPGVARSGAPGAGLSGHWIRWQPEANWTDETTIINGRRIYSFRGGATATLDYYDIPGNTWTNSVAYLRSQETFTTGSGYAYTSGGYLYIQKDVTGRIFRYSPSTNTMDGWSTILYGQGAVVSNDRMFDVSYTDGATTLRFVYFLLNTSTVMLRALVI